MCPALKIYFANIGLFMDFTKSITIETIEFLIFAPQEHEKIK